MNITFIILIITTIFFIHGKYRADFIAVGSLLALTLSGVITPTEALSGFSNSVVIMFAGLFIVGAGIFNTGLAKQLGNRLIKYGGNSENKLLIIIILTVGGLSAFMSNTGTVAVLLPVIISIAMSVKISPAKLLIPLAFASSLGGTITIIGTPPNLVVSNMLNEHGFESIGFFHFAPIGLVILLTGIIFMVTIGKKLLPNHGGNITFDDEVDPSKLAGTYKIHDKLHMVKIMENSSILDQTLARLQISNLYDITLVSISRKNGRNIPPFNNETHIVPKAHTTLEAGDYVLLLGENVQVEKFMSDYQLSKIDHSTKAVRDYLLSDTFGISELIIPAESNFINKTIRDLHFRKKYGCSVLAVYRNGKYIQTDACKMKLKSGDSLLIHGHWDQIEALAATSYNVITVGRVDDIRSSETARGKAWIAGTIMGLMLLVMTFELLDPVITVLIAAMLMVLTGCVKSMGDTYRIINWEALILIAAMLPMATALENTGGVKFISDSVINLLGDYGPYAVLIGFYLITNLLSQFISNTATAVITAPIAIATAIDLGVSPYPFVIAVAMAASIAFATPVATPTNALVMNAGGYKFKDYVIIGVPLQIILAIVILIFIPIFYPL